MSINYVACVDMTDEEKTKMYMRCKKLELVEMLIQCHKIIDTRNSISCVKSEPH